MHMLRITLSEKAEMKIAEELKELKKLADLRKLKDTKEKELEEIQAKAAKLNSMVKDELTSIKKRIKEESSMRDDDVTRGSKARRLESPLRERSFENPRPSDSIEMNFEAETVKIEDDIELSSDEHYLDQKPSFDLRGFLVGKQIRQIRRSEELKQRQGWGAGNDGARHEGRWSVEPKYRRDMYAFDPNNPVANPDWNPDLQVIHFTKN